MLREKIKTLSSPIVIAYLLLSLAAGSFFAFAIPIGFTEDEDVHAFRAYTTSRGNFSTTDEFSAPSTHAPTSDTYYIYKTPVSANLADYYYSVWHIRAASGCEFSIMPKYGISFRYYQNSGCAKAEEALVESSERIGSQRLDPNNSTIVETAGASGYSFIGYLPSAIGFFAAQLINPSVETSIYMARIASLLFTIAVTVIALYILRNNRAKWLVFVTALLPGYLVLSIGPNIDAALLPLCLLFFALYIRLASDRSLSFRHPLFWLITLVAILIPILKAPYAVISITAALLPLFSKGARGIGERIGHVVIILLPGILFNLSIRQMDAATGYLLFPDTPRSDDLMLFWMIQHPVEYIQLLIRSFLVSDYFSAISILTHQRVRLPAILTVMSYIALFTAGLYAAQDYIRRPLRKQLYFLVAIITAGIGAAIVLPTLSFARHTLYSDIIMAQGRYFIPFLPFIALMVGIMSRAVIKTANPRLTSGLFLLFVATTLLLSCVWYYGSVYLWAAPHQS